MDINSKQVTIVLEAIATTCEALITMSQQLRANSQVESAMYSLNFRKYQPWGVMIELDVSAWLKKQDKSISWWLEIGWNEGHWVIEHSILTNENDIQETLKEFETKTPQSINELIEQLEEATSDLITSLQIIVL